MRKYLDERNNCWVNEFQNINEFVKYLRTQPINGAFRKFSTLPSEQVGTSMTKFSNTETYKEAEDLLLNGWNEYTEEVKNQIKNPTVNMQEIKKISMYDVLGFQCSVPRYIQGIPTSMINRKNVVVKQKIVDVTKLISYGYKTSTQTIIKESIKAIRIIQCLESQGFRVNLNIAFGSVAKSGRGFICKVKIKSCNERLNISKLMFPLIHPAMLRRIYLKWVEVFPETLCSMTKNYGYTMPTYKFSQVLKNSHLLPPMISGEGMVKNLEELKNLAIY